MVAAIREGMGRLSCAPRCQQSQVGLNYRQARTSRDRASGNGLAGSRRHANPAGIGFVTAAREVPVEDYCIRSTRVAAPDESA